MRKIIFSLIGFVLLAAVLAAPLSGPAGAAVEAQAPGPRPVVREATRTDQIQSMRRLPPIPPVLGEIFQTKPPKKLPNRPGGAGSNAPDPVLQEALVGTSTANTLSSFEGVSNVNGVLPPDTVGDIGPNHYVQMVNLSFAVYDRSGNLLYGPVDNNTLWQGFGGPCETTNDGDPVVLYDHLADRWLMSQFALPKYPRGPFYQCIAVSQTGNPLGGWNRYEFLISQKKLNDYPKFGVWSDGYYMTVNQFTCNMFFCNWGGEGVVAFERDQMLSGQQARMVYFDLYNTDPNLAGMLPSDLDGPAPPAGAPNVFAQFDDDAWGYSPDQLQLWQFHVDWANTANSTFTKAATLNTAAFDSNMCGGSRNCIPQPGGTNVDAIADRLMFRLQYRNFGDHQTLVVNHTVDVDGTDHAGVRWYELRDSGGGWDIQQQGTFAPDGDQRWMGSAAMNGNGSLALGYSVSSYATSPSIRYTGRLAGDPPGLMTQGEGEIVAGAGYQQHTSGRWGDYSMLAVDPTDDCTFWYTQEYYASVSSAGWQTRIGSFQLPDCGGTPVDNPPSVTLTNPTDGATVSGSVLVTADASDDQGVTQVAFFVDDASIGVDNDGTDGWSASWDTTAYSNGSHTVTATATDTAPQTASDSVGVTVDNGSVTPTTLHVGDLDGSSVNNGATWQANVTVTVHDDQHNLLANATVSGAWSGGASGMASCTTDGSGQCSVLSQNVPKKTGTVTFSVTDVTHASLTYDSSANHDPDGDSDGTTIVVSK
ncbi:MAG: Ig-like domain-containing protein [Anaerolineales bacterium]